MPWKRKGKNWYWGSRNYGNISAKKREQIRKAIKANQNKYKRKKRRKTRSKRR